MKAVPVIGIQPAVLRWARQSLNLSIPAVADKIKRSVDEVAAWESGGSAPTYAQLEKLAYQIYKIPLAVFFLPTPPKVKTPAKEFRTLPDSDLQSLVPDTHLLIRRAHAYKLALEELFGNNSPSERCIWKDIQLSRNKSVRQQAQKVRNYLGISLQDQISWRSDDKALKKWRAALEEVGVFVFKESFKQKEISGFCLFDNVHPVIYLNNGTSKTRQIFSLFHEFAHLLLGANSIGKFGKSHFDLLPHEQKKIEIFCNAFTAELLIPKSDFHDQVAHFPEAIEDCPDEAIATLAARYGVSREAILRCFLDEGRVSAKHYELKAKEWTGQKKPKASKGGPSYYVTKSSYLSNRFALEVVSQHYRQQISVEKAADMLGIKAKSYPGLEDRLIRGGRG